MMLGQGIVCCGSPLFFMVALPFTCSGVHEMELVEVVLDVWIDFTDHLPCHLTQADHPVFMERVGGRRLSFARYALGV